MFKYSLSGIIQKIGHHFLFDLFFSSDFHTGELALRHGGKGYFTLTLSKNLELFLNISKLPRKEMQSFQSQENLALIIPSTTHRSRYLKLMSAEVKYLFCHLLC